MKGRRFSSSLWLLLLAAVLAAPVASAQPSFGTDTIGHRTYLAGSAITPVTLPAASGSPAYTLPGLPASLVFTPATRVLSGTPSQPAAVSAYTYTATSGGNSASLTFRLAVIPANAATDGFIVSNLGGGHRVDGVQGASVLATAFVTGANTGGYTMTGAVIRFGAHSRNNLCSLSIYSDDGSLLGTLDGPTGALPAGGHLAYTSARGIPLATSTTYWLATAEVYFNVLAISS